MRECPLAGLRFLGRSEETHNSRASKRGNVRLRDCDGFSIVSTPNIIASKRGNARLRDCDIFCILYWIKEIIPLKERSLLVGLEQQIGAWKSYLPVLVLSPPLYATSKYPRSQTTLSIPNGLSFLRKLSAVRQTSSRGMSSVVITSVRIHTSG